MSQSSEPSGSPKLVENSLLALLGLLAHLPLYYQLSRWAYGLDPTFVHPSWTPRFSSLALHMIAVHPFVWIAVLIAASIRVCRNYGWTLAKRCPLSTAAITLRTAPDGGVPSWPANR
jgi:hypothetical protein